MQPRSIPFFSLTQHTEQLKHTLLEQFKYILQTQQFIGGPIVDSFENAFASYLGTRFVISCNSGTDALRLALLALETPKQSIVITTPFSFIASVSEIVTVQAHPIFIDIEPQVLTLCPKEVERWLISNTHKHQDKTIHKITGFPVVGMLPVNIFGTCANFNALQQIAKEWGLWIIEDACQSIGSEMRTAPSTTPTNPIKSGTLGHISAISFYPTKNLGACGDAGACTTNDPALASKIKRLRNHGRSSHYNYEELGYNSRMDCIQATILTEKLKYLPTYIHRRRLLAERYQTILQELPLILPNEIYSTHTYHQFPIILPSTELRNQLINFLKEQGIETKIFYPTLLGSFHFLQTNKLLIENCHVAQKTVDHIVSLPMWPELAEEDVDYVAKKVKTFMDINISKYKTTTIYKQIE